MKSYILITILLISSSAIGQTSTCKCDSVYRELTQKLEADYLGLKQAELSGKSGSYQAKKLAFKVKAGKVPANECISFLQDFLNQFKDGHLFVFERPQYPPAELASYKNKVRESRIEPAKLSALLETQMATNNPAGKDGLIGNWSDGSSVFAILKEKDAYKAYIISSKDTAAVIGGVKAQFKKRKNGFDGMIYPASYRPRHITGNLYKEATLFAMDGGIYWGKVESAFAREISMINKESVMLPTITKLDDKNTLFSIPSFNIEANQFNKILEDNYGLLLNTTNLIIDIRGNTGGNAIYLSFLDGYATKGLDASQGLVLASEDTKRYYEAQAKYAKDIFEPVVDRISKNPGQIVDGPLYPAKSIVPLKTKIQKVAILTDKGCMSAAESFILHSKNVSSKVITFGSPTGGVIDYTSVNTVKLNSSGMQTIYFGYPTSSWHKQIPANGYNRTGIIPDVPVKDSEKDKISFIVNYLSKRTD
jgi:hypothetical protein